MTAAPEVGSLKPPLFVTQSLFFGPSDLLSPCVFQNVFYCPRKPGSDVRLGSHHLSPSHCLLCLVLYSHSLTHTCLRTDAKVYAHTNVYTHTLVHTCTHNIFLSTRPRVIVSILNSNVSGLYFSVSLVCFLDLQLELPAPGVISLNDLFVKSLYR